MVWRSFLLLLWSMKNNDGMESFEEKICSCALNKIFGFSPKTGLALIECIGSAAEIFRMKSGEIDELLGPYSKYRGRIRDEALAEAEKELRGLENEGVRFVGWSGEDYPSLLHECEDAPIGLYVRSSTPPNELWRDRRRIAVVGTRDISAYGREWCIRTVTGLSESAEKPVIVSGLAIGTDFHAHRTALECGLPTIGVMATGPDDVYPARHRAFAEKMCRTQGCALITDYPPGTPPLGIHFLRRNRIIAGLCDSTIVTESKLKGGAMMTCRLAFSYNRDVYALPGRADDIRSQGCNSLIRSKMAEPFTSVEELIESLGLDKSRKSPAMSMIERLDRAYRDSMPPEQIGMMDDVLSLISKERGLAVDDISAVTGIPFHQLSNITTMLEADGFITMDLLRRCSINISK